jgi:hypothetical protein
VRIPGVAEVTLRTVVGKVDYGSRRIDSCVEVESTG